MMGFLLLKYKKVTSAKAEVTIVREVKLLQRLRGSNSQVNGHTDHGVVTCAQEVHSSVSQKL